MQRPYYPICESVDIYSDIPIDLGAPRRKVGSIVIKTVYGLFAHRSDKVNSGLEIKAFLVHHDGDHIMGVTLGLLNVVRKEVLIANTVVNMTVQQDDGI